MHSQMGFWNNITAFIALNIMKYCIDEAIPSLFANMCYFTVTYATLKQ